MGPPFLRGQQSTRRSGCLRGNTCTVISKLKTLSIGPVQGIKPATSRSAVKPSFNDIQGLHSNLIELYFLWVSFIFQCQNFKFFLLEIGTTNDYVRVATEDENLGLIIINNNDTFIVPNFP